MARERSFVNIAACCVVSNSAWCRILSREEKYHGSLLSILGHCFDGVSLGKALNRHMLNLTKVKMSTWKDKDGNVYDKFNAPKLLHDCMLAVELKWHTHEQVQ